MPKKIIEYCMTFLRGILSFRKMKDRIGIKMYVEGKNIKTYFKSRY